MQDKIALENEPDAENLDEPQPRESSALRLEGFSDETSYLKPSSEGQTANETKTSFMRRPASFELARIIQTPQGPALKVNGYLPDGATKLLPAEQSLQSGVLHVTLVTERDPEAISTMAIVPYEILIPLTDPPPTQIILNGQSLPGGE